MDCYKNSEPTVFMLKVPKFYVTVTQVFEFNSRSDVYFMVLLLYILLKKLLLCNDL